MGKTHPHLDKPLRDFLTSHPLFFVASAPRADSGHINLSPKGLDTFKILAPDEIAYLDLVGSGIETVAHVRENERLVLMFCAFAGPPRIVRLWGRARVVEPEDDAFNSLRANFESELAVRAIITLKLSRIADSCGYGVPLFEYKGDRPQLDYWREQKSAAEIEAYKTRMNARSIDGLPGLRSRCP
ncbi:MAG: hypothetical protein ACI8QZ_003677 [Chlamydiales bacterium]|jgi:hypothetical protein